MAAEICLCSSGLLWDGRRLAARYAFLRRRRGEVRLDLLYYPYRLLEIHGVAAWRFFGKRPLCLLLAQDARTGACLRVPSFPALREEKLVFLPGEGRAGFCPARMEGPGLAGQAPAHVAPPSCSGEEADKEAEAFALAAWGRRCNLPLGPRADIRLTGKKAFFLHKPFWIMRPEAEPSDGKIFLFDASTGLGGVSEYWNVAEYALSLGGTPS